jgi:hypothetical protein
MVESEFVLLGTGRDSDGVPWALLPSRLRPGPSSLVVSASPLSLKGSDKTPREPVFTFWRAYWIPYTPPPAPIVGSTGTSTAPFATLARDSA